MVISASNSHSTNNPDVIEICANQIQNCMSKKKLMLMERHA